MTALYLAEELFYSLATITDGSTQSRMKAERMAVDMLMQQTNREIELYQQQVNISKQMIEYIRNKKRTWLDSKSWFKGNIVAYKARILHYQKRIEQKQTFRVQILDL